MADWPGSRLGRWPHPQKPVDELTAELSGLRTRLDHIAGTVEQLARNQAQLWQESLDTRHRQALLAQAMLDDEAATRRLLYAARESDQYALAFEDPEPLVSVCIPTYANFQGLVSRAIPSALAQDHPSLEVIVVGDGAPPETKGAIAALGDRRVRYENLPVRGQYPEDEDACWLVAGTPAFNRAMQLAEGRWIAILNDDDAMRSDHVSSLLTVARETRAEVVYGRLERHAPDGQTEIICDFPPASHAFGWQAALQHSALKLFEYELWAWLFSEPGDWSRARRMLRAGVTFRQIDKVVGDYYPGKLWRP